MWENNLTNWQPTGREVDLQQPQSQTVSELEWIRSKLITLIGYEIWTPLSTIQVCLESLANEPKIAPDSRQIILDTAVQDIQYLHRLIEDCLTFSPADFAERAIEYTSLQAAESSPEILQNILTRILSLHSVEVRSGFVVEIGDRFVKQNIILSDTSEKVIQHIRKNLIAIVGHEIRTPLCAIEACLESLSDEASSSMEYRQTMLDIALGDISRLRKIMDDFFLLERLEKKQIYHRSQYVLVREVIDLALESLKFRQDSTSIPRIVVEIPPQLPLVRIDEDILLEALSKLLDNACKFTHAEGEIKIKAQIVKGNTNTNFPQTLTNKMLEVAISDNGRGIVPHNLEAIFNCFYQEENSLRRTANGTGIGLTICRHLISLLGGKIWANSQGKNLGTSIHITLPLIPST